MRAPAAPIDPAILPALEVSSVSAGYGGRAVVRGIDLAVRPGEIVAVLGPNGAGKTTLLRTLAGAIEPLSGDVRVAGRPAAAGLHRRARGGVGYVAEEKTVFMGLTVAENLRIGSGDPDDAFDLFPELSDHRHRRAGLLSGGQQQMLALARALIMRPSVLLADELSLGLAPLIVTRLLDTVRRVADTGVAVVLVEQHARQALAVADRAIALRRGDVVMAGSAAEISRRRDELEAAYLSADDAARSS